MAGLTRCFASSNFSSFFYIKFEYRHHPHPYGFPSLQNPCYPFLIDSHSMITTPYPGIFLSCVPNCGSRSQNYFLFSFQMLEGFQTLVSCGCQRCWLNFFDGNRTRAYSGRCLRTHQQGMKLFLFSSNLKQETLSLSILSLFYPIHTTIWLTLFRIPAKSRCFTEINSPCSCKESENFVRFTFPIT